MLNSYERCLLVEYLPNIGKRFTWRSRKAEGLVEWIAENADLLGLDARKPEGDEQRYRRNANVSARQWRGCKNWWIAPLNRSATRSLTGYCVVYAMWVPTARAVGCLPAMARGRSTSSTAAVPTWSTRVSARCGST